mgnify:FL=1
MTDDDKLDDLLDWLADDFRLEQEDKELIKAGAMQVKNLLTPPRQYRGRYVVVSWSNPECTYENLRLFTEAYCDGDMHAWLIPFEDDTNDKESTP